MKELFPLKTFHQDAILKRLSELYENEVDLDSRVEDLEDLELPEPSLADAGKYIGIGVDGKYTLSNPTAASISGTDITPKDVTASGNITAPSIVETMNGYAAFIGQSDEYLTIDNIYTSVCKNGNKLTFVAYLKIKRLDTLPQRYRNIAIFSIPSDVFNKLYPIATSGALNTVLAVNESVYFKDLVLDNNKKIVTTIYKTSQNVLFTAEDLTVLDVNEDYYVRIEQTFLLSDNLVPQE